jgi:hypothetical protein
METEITLPPTALKHIEWFGVWILNADLGCWRTANRDSHTFISRMFALGLLVEN